MTLMDTAKTLEAFATVLALLVGAVWSYMLFIKKRQKYPRAKVKHGIFSELLTRDKRLIKVTTDISNKGDVLLSLESGVTRIYQISPLSAEIKKAIGTMNNRRRQVKPNSIGRC